MNDTCIYVKIILQKEDPYRSTAFLVFRISGYHTYSSVNKPTLSFPTFLKSHSVQHTHLEGMWHTPVEILVYRGHIPMKVWLPYSTRRLLYNMPLSSGLSFI